MKKYFLLIFYLLLSQSKATPSETIRYVIFPNPPFIIGAETAINREPSGIEIDIVRELARRMKMKIAFIKCPLIRCLKLIEDGKADLVSSLFKRPERELYMRYFDLPYLDKYPIAFYSRKGSGISIAEYKDLYKLASPIGMLHGGSYFPQFDNDARLNKKPVARQEQLFPMLLAKRFDVIAGYVPAENYRLITEGLEGKVEKSEFEYDGVNYLYLAIGRKSPLTNRFEELNSTHKAMLTDGFIEHVLNFYRIKYSLK
ncbi:hypothetical protein D0T25_23490 [Duganella sp. BJB488]|nr:ABC transporter substrate-binding protein [Duganella sp. BJB488]RFP09286.1 hypothetical protein D0T23_26625 [Duganella sp. BJB475]RFP13175.1 hypothetical protein D0T26_23065 [Duganella sp. BJB489]RFP25321.1 hypothetical protein D0T21_27655 [Duganella sp. BJB476]RFP31529.1 hypothetical protein D0T24_24155 [Duganella sp. BJB480]RFP17063.1 hypothetical protein D0T25_23490 [Duganella sp. BJB488]